MNSDSAPHAPGTDEPDPHTPCDRSRVLIIEDEETIANLFGIIISNAFQEVIVQKTDNGDDALLCFRKQHPGIIITDVNLPVMAGHEIFRNVEAICAENDWQMPFFIFCTGEVHSKGMNDIVRNDQRHGVLAKPVSAATLVEMVRSRLP